MSDDIKSALYGCPVCERTNTVGHEERECLDCGAEWGMSDAPKWKILYAYTVQGKIAIGVAYE